MKVLPINYFNIKQQYANQRMTGIKASYALSCDTVCFKSRELLNLPKEELYKKIKNSLTPENFLGQGTEAEVYRIKDTDYCVRIPYNALSTYSTYSDKDMNCMYLDKNIEPVERVNHTLAKLSSGATIMKYIEGVCPKDYINNSDSRYKFQAKIADLPTKSYTNFFHQIANGLDNDMMFDCSSGNLLVDFKNKKMTAIDFIPISENSRDVKPLCEMYSVLTAYGAERETGKKIFENIMSAGLDEFKPKNTPCMDVELFDFVDLCERRIYDSKANNIERLMKKISQQVGILKELKSKEHLNELFSTFLEEKVAEIKSLIKYIK